MKKQTVRFLVLCLVAVLLLPAVVACDDSGEPNATTTTPSVSSTSSSTTTSDSSSGSSSTALGEPSSTSGSSAEPTPDSSTSDSSAEPTQSSSTSSSSVEPTPTDPTEGLVFRLKSDGVSYAVIGYTGNASIVVIPFTYNTLPVTSIGNAAFRDCTTLTSISIPRSVTSIGEDAFSGCTGLASITIPSGVTTIGPYAFRGCTGLTRVTIPSTVNIISTFAFSGCDGLKGVYITDLTAWCGIRFVDERANPLHYAQNLYLNNTLVTNLVIPNTVTSIGAYAFCGCTGLTSVTLPSSVTTIGEEAFFGCSKLVEVINLSTLQITAGDTANGYVACCSLEVHKGTTKIVNQNDYLFYTYGGVNYLLGYTGTETTLTLPANYNGANYIIYNSAFEGCSGLVSITIPSAVTSIGAYAFRGCTGLTSVTFENTSGWYYTEFASNTSGTSVDVTDPATNATNLTETYKNYYWNR